ncbi:aldolase/citrate lyase family protein [Shigella flexneri]
MQIEQLLDVGTQTLLVPMVPKTLTKPVTDRATRYPPPVFAVWAVRWPAPGAGIVFLDYLQKADDQMCVLVQIETREAMKNLPQVWTWKASTACLSAQRDLSTDIGYAGNPQHPEVPAAIEQAMVQRSVNRAKRGDPNGQ